jgi:hypothetical protein
LINFSVWMPVDDPGQDVGEVGERIDVEWNRNFMVNILSLDQYYKTKRSEFEHLLQPRFVLIDRCLRAIRRSSANDGCPPNYIKKKDLT